MPLDVVYILADESDNNNIELRYSLRSLKNVPHKDVYLVTKELPKWVHNVKHIKCEDQKINKQLNALNKITAACKSDTSEDFILMNDDFYILQKTNVPYLVNGTLRELIERRGCKSEYVQCLERTDKLFKYTKNFEIHFPIEYNKLKFLALDFTGGPYVHRSLYCNHYDIMGEESKDNKVYSRSSLTDENVPFMSSSDSYVGSSRFRKTMDKLFPEKSRYENIDNY